MSSAEELEFISCNAKRLHCVHAQKHYLFFWKNNSLYKFDIKQILKKPKLFLMRLLNTFIVYIIYLFFYILKAKQAFLRVWHC
jgi:hypothetical protein